MVKLLHHSGQLCMLVSFFQLEMVVHQAIRQQSTNDILISTSVQVEGSPCDAASYDVDDVFLERVERALQGLETLPLEQNDA